MTVTPVENEQKSYDRLYGTHHRSDHSSAGVHDQELILDHHRRLH